MTTSNPGSAPDDFHGVADEAIRSVVQTESHLDIRQGGHAVLGKLFLHRAQKGPVCRPIIFGIPAKGSYTQGRTKTAPQLFILPEHLQTALQSEDHDCQLCFLDLLLQPIRDVVWNIRLPDVYEVLELIECEQAHAAVFEQFPQTDALAHC